MRRWVLAGCAVTALFIALPAAATHSPNGERGLVTMAATRNGAELTFNYNVVQRACPNPHCDVNFGKPYRILIFVDGANGTSALASPPQSLVSGPAHCSVSGSPLVDCNTPGRSQTDPAAALPMNGSIKVRVGTRAGAKAEIDAIGYSLNTYQEDIPVPEWNCTDLQERFDAAQRAFNSAELGYREALRRLIASERAVLVGGSLWRRISERAELLSRLADEQHIVEAHQTELSVADVVLRNCLKRQKADARPSSSAQTWTCTAEEWGTLLERGRALKFKNVRSLVRKITAEQKAKKRVRVARDVKRLRDIIRAEVKQLTAFEKAIKACE